MEQAGLSVSALHIHRLISKESLLSWVLVVNDWVILIWSVCRSDSFPVVFRSPIDKERSAVSFLTPLALPSVTRLECRPPLLQPSPPLKQAFPHRNRDTGHEKGFRYQFEKCISKMNRLDIYPRFILQNLVKIVKRNTDKIWKSLRQKKCCRRSRASIFIFVGVGGRQVHVSHQGIFCGRMAKFSRWFVCQLLRQRPLIRAWAKERKLTRPRGIKNSNNLNKR